MMKHFADKVCCICKTRFNVEEHHLFGASNRNNSDRDGLTVYLCADCHRQHRESVHQSGTVAQWAHMFGQVLWMLDTGLGVDDFRRRYGKNYLGDFKTK